MLKLEKRLMFWISKKILIQIGFQQFTLSENIKTTLDIFVDAVLNNFIDWSISQAIFLKAFLQIIIDLDDTFVHVESSK